MRIERLRGIGPFGHNLGSKEEINVEYFMRCWKKTSQCFETTSEWTEFFELVLRVQPILSKQEPMQSMWETMSSLMALTRCAGHGSCHIIHSLWSLLISLVQVSEFVDIGGPTREFLRLFDKRILQIKLETALCSIASRGALGGPFEASNILASLRKDIRERWRSRTSPLTFLQSPQSLI